MKFRFEAGNAIETAFPDFGFDVSFLSAQSG